MHFDSRRAGWRSLDLELLSVDAEAERVELPAIDAQLIDLQIHGTRLVSSRRRSGWATGLLGPGSLSTTAPGATSSLRWSSPTGDDHVTQIRLLIPAPTMTRVASEAFGGSASRFRPPDGLAFDDDVLRALLTRLHRAARAGVSELYAATAAEFIAVHLLTNHGTAPAPPRPARDDARVARAVDLLHDRLDRPVTLAELAAEAGLSRFHLLRLFRQQTGETPAQLHQRLRLDLARRLLRTTSLTVAAVAHRCGFADQSHFAKAFRRQVGASPTGYRADAGGRVTDDRFHEGRKVT
ncbi:helix-turn-helix domain-containing protein [Verrucosispora sp. NA02020]|uniref:helix-turn-helix domain-containing protein n=1 Tax=Verrucosispora sp. NA02020 TaxID=2742132 RepID=UPI003D7033A7